MDLNTRAGLQESGFAGQRGPVRQSPTEVAVVITDATAYTPTVKALDVLVAHAT
jgi:hypothetical protein